MGRIRKQIYQSRLIYLEICWFALPEALKKRLGVTDESPNSGELLPPALTFAQIKQKVQNLNAKKKQSELQTLADEITASAPTADDNFGLTDLDMDVEASVLRCRVKSSLKRMFFWQLLWPTIPSW